MDRRFESYAGGILTVAETIAEHTHAVVSDLDARGYDLDEDVWFGGRLSLSKLVSIVIASPPNSAVRYAVEKGWSQTDMLLANMAEQQAGLTELPARYDRPGLPEDTPDLGGITPGAGGRYIVHTIDEFQAHRARVAARAAELAATEKRLA